MLQKFGIKREDVKSFECKHVVYTEDGQGNDLLTVKEYIHTHDGRSFPNVRRIHNYKRDFWVTLPHYQNHKDKKEWEEARFLQKHTINQAKLREQIVLVTGQGRFNSTMQHLARNQYLYGADIGTPALLKNFYQEKWKDSFTPNRICVMDTETDTLAMDDTIILCTITMRDKVYVTARRDWVESLGPIGDLEETVRREAFKERPYTPDELERMERDKVAGKKVDKPFRLAEILRDRNVTIEVGVFNTDTEMVVSCIERLHVWQPDFVTFWNMDFDMSRIEEALIYRGGFSNEDMADLFSDPSVPKQFRKYNYRRDNPLKRKDDGSFENKASYDMWHTLETPASFYFIDSMCTYRRIRLAAGKLPSYGLDAVMKLHLNMGKMYDKLPGITAKESTLTWHMEMQQHQKIAYILYNIFDCIGVELLDEKILDLNTQVSMLSKSSEYRIFHSNPRKTADALHFHVQRYGYIVGTCSDRMEDELDALLPGKENWILALPCHMMVNNGIPMIRELPNVRSMIRLYVFDADIVSTYPHGEIAMNLSKQTTMMEVCRIHGLTLSNQQLLGINVTGGPSNAMKIMTEVCKLPKPVELLKLYTAETGSNTIRLDMDPKSLLEYTAENTQQLL